MQRTSVKIFVSVLLALVLWGGAGFFGVKNVYAEAPAGVTQTSQTTSANGNVTTVWSDGYTTTYNPSTQTSVTKDANGNIMTTRSDTTALESGAWFTFIQGFKNMPGVLADGALKTAIAIIGGLMQLITIPVLGILLRIIASCLDQAIQFTLNSANISNSGVSGAITTVWVLVRNIFNITFIFILLYAAIKTIIGSASANTKKTIAHVVWAALLINFSLFITRIVIDAGNILGAALYNSATSNGLHSISEIIMNTLGFGALWASTGTDSIFSVAFFVITILQILTITTAIITLIFVMLLMLARSVVLVFLMALSPIGFMGDVLPKISEYSTMWRENLYGQVFVAPIFLLLFYLITLLGQNLTPAGLSGADKDYAQYFKFIMIIILLFAAVKITKKMSGVIGAAIEKYGTMAAGAAVGIATGGMAFAGRRLIGAGAEALKGSEWGEKLKKSDTLASRLTLKGLDKTSKSSFDIRGTGAFKTATGFIGEQTGLKVDYERGLKIKEGGFQGTIERREKRAEEFAKMASKEIPKTEVERQEQVKNERIKIDVALAENERKMKGLNLADTTQANLDLIDNLQKEKGKMEGRKGLNDEALRKKLEQERKDNILETQAGAEGKGIINKMLGGEMAKKAAAAKVRKMKGEKTADQIIKEYSKKKKEEDKAVGITEPEEEKPKEEKKGEPKPEPATTPPPVTPTA